LGAGKTRSQPAEGGARPGKNACKAAPYPSVQCIILAIAQDALLGRYDERQTRLLKKSDAANLINFYTKLNYWRLPKLKILKHELQKRWLLDDRLVFETEILANLFRKTVITSKIVNKRIPN